LSDEFFEKDIYVEVALPVAQFMTFTYRIPSSLLRSVGDKKLIGRRVLVPFKKKGFSGIITDISQNTEDIRNIRDVIDFPDKKPVFPENYIKAIKNISDYYISPIGISLNNLIPEGLRWEYSREKKRWITKGEINYVITPDITRIDSSIKLTKRSRELLEILIEKGELSLDQIRELGFSKKTVDTLFEKGLIKKINIHLREGIRLRQEKGSFSTEKRRKGVYVYSFDDPDTRLKKYISIFSKLLKEGKTGIIIFPNVASVKKVYRDLNEKFGERVIPYFDGIPEKDKTDIWFSLMESSGFIIVGTYSSAFVPAKDLSLIIIEEEQSDSYKPLRTPRFDLRRAVYEIYRHSEGISVIYGSSVPSVESYYSLGKGLLKNLEKKEDITGINTEILIKKYEKGMYITELKKIPEDKTVLILSNRKGYASFLYCERCEEEVLCERCDYPLKIHKEDTKYTKCEVCGKKYQYLDRCLRCDLELKEIGTGTEKIYEDIKKIFPDQVSFIDEERKTRIKVGTTVMDKEFVYDRYDFVINVYPDIFLFMPDFKGDEVFFKSLFQPLFLSKERYIVLTNAKENPALLSLSEKKPSLFYESELENRKISGLPPFRRFILLTFEKKGLSIESVKSIFEKWLKDEKIRNIDYEGVFYAYRSKIRDRNRVQIILKDFKEKEKLKRLYEKSSEKGIKLIIDVDPKQIV